MRKSNSIFKTAFVSEAGAELANNDYFAYVEDDDFACYVLAAGITDFETSVAAKEVVEHLILSFEEKPGMSKSTLLNYMEETNQRLLSGSHGHRLKASVIMLVTDYEKFRYVAAGNVRLRMYRQGRFFLKSSDMSLANDLIKKGESETPLDKHEERHNLYAYLGKKDFFKPFVSKIQKLEDADILTLYSCGLWEHVDEHEIDEIFAEATDNPQESVDLLEDVLLSRQPKDLKSYTVAAIFVNKIFKDPEREHKRQLYMKIAAIVVIILIVIAIIYYIFYRIRQGKIETFEHTVQQAQELITNENFKRGRDVTQEALKMARDLDFEQEEQDLKEDLMVLDNIVQGEEFFSMENYHAAYDNYLKALQYSHASSKNTRDYLQRRIDIIEIYLDMSQFMLLGDHLFQNGDYDNAEAVYLKASQKASTLHDNKSRDMATAALEKIYDKRAELRRDAEQKLNNKKQMAMNDAMKKGDELLAAGDLEGAQQAYLDARNLSNNIADRTQTSAALDKVSDARTKIEFEKRTSEEERKKRFDSARDTEAKGNACFDSGDYASAQMYYLSAIDQYIALSENVKVEILQSKLDAAKFKSGESYSQKNDAEKAEESARNFYAEKNFTAAKAAAAQAKEIYNALGKKSKVEEMDILLEQIAVDSMIADAVK